MSAIQVGLEAVPSIANATAKRVIDVAVSIAVLIVLSPVLLVVALLVRLSGRQIIFGHRRVGLSGRTFVCYKFRSMVPNAAEVLAHLLETDPAARREWEASQKLKNDPRITFIGKFLRKTSLDELPQLWNVIRGDMSLVGPRPVIEDELERYGAHRTYYLSVRPGVTGIWQLSGRSDTGYDERIAMDIEYVKNWSLRRDIELILRTAFVPFRTSSAC